MDHRGRGNVKSTEVSCKCLYHMCADAIYPPYRPELAKFELEPEAECAAVDRGQAMRVFGDAKKIANASPNIAKRLNRRAPVSRWTQPYRHPWSKTCQGWGSMGCPA